MTLSQDSYTEYLLSETQLRDQEGMTAENPRNSSVGDVKLLGDIKTPLSVELNSASNSVSQSKISEKALFTDFWMSPDKGNPRDTGGLGVLIVRTFEEVLP